tara:strand:- start:174 stop:1328 length:1155 start_codon:yes stop_codon:yes gene_type:complete
MKGLLIFFTFCFLSACGGGSGGGNSTPSEAPKVSVSGPLTVWSDDDDWSAQATAAGMDASTLAFTMSGGDSYIEIDSITGVINSTGYNVDAGSHRFTVSASDASGASASTTYDLRSDAFIAGVWLPLFQTDGEFFTMFVTRSGKIHSVATKEGSAFEECSGTFSIIGGELDGEINCNALNGVDANWSADIEATMNGEFIINKMTITSGQFTGEVNDEPMSFYRDYDTIGLRIPPGLYGASASNGAATGYVELRVNADGSFDTLSAEEAIVYPEYISDCRINGNIATDPINGLATAPSHSSSTFTHDSKLTATGCAAEFDQSMVDAVAFSTYGNATPILFFGTPGNSALNGGYNASNSLFIQMCDELNQPTGAMPFGRTCEAEAP